MEPEAEAGAGTTTETTEAATTESTEVVETDTGIEQASTEVTTAEPEGDTQTVQNAEYQDFTLPEGITADNEVFGEFKEFAKDLNLNQVQAQNAVDIGMKLVQKQNDTIKTAWTEQLESWVNTLREDGEFGGAHFDQTIERANRALRQFGDESLIADLETVGFGVHPGLVKLLARIDMAIGEDAAGTGGGSKPQPKSAADIMFD